MWDQLWTGFRLAQGGGDAASCALAVSEGKIAWIGPEKNLPEGARARDYYPLKNAWLTPGLIDCHTHLVFAGSRAEEFSLRLQGVSYAEIAARGGGILKTVKATREASFDQLYRLAAKRLRAMIAQGVTTVEIKSGYGLDLENEIKMLQVARQLEKDHPIRIKTTYLGLHALPKEYQGRPQAYIDRVCQQILPAIAAENLADAVDAFCDPVGFSAEETQAFFACARRLSLPIHCHADQFGDSGGALLAATYQALSVDHLEYLSPSAIPLLKQSGTVAVLLPGAYYYLQQKQPPPIARLAEAGVPMAIATDANPGSSPLFSLPTAMNMACVLFGLTPEAALSGVSVHAAKALGLSDQTGKLAVGFSADFVVWDFENPFEMAYVIGQQPVRAVVSQGTIALDHLALLGEHHDTGKRGASSPR